MVFVVTCYFRHLGRVFERAGIEVSSENRKEVNTAIHAIVGVEYKNCPAAWREVKKRLEENEESFVSELKRAMSRHT